MRLAFSTTAVRAAALFALVVAASACGNGAMDIVAPPTATPTPAPVMTLLKQGSVSRLQPSSAFHLPFTTSEAGTITTTADWTVASDDVWIGVAAGQNPCVGADNLFRPSTCPFIKTSESRSVKPKTLTLAGQAAGTYSLYIVNSGPNQEAASYQIFLAH